MRTKQSEGPALKPGDWVKNNFRNPWKGVIVALHETRRELVWVSPRISKTGQRIQKARQRPRLLHIFWLERIEPPCETTTP